MDPLCLQKGVDKARVAKAFPYGKVEVKVVGGGLRWHSGIVAPKLGKLTGLTARFSAIPVATCRTCKVAAVCGA